MGASLVVVQARPPTAPVMLSSMRGLVTNLNQYTLRYGRDFPNDFRRTLNQRVRTLNQHFRDAETDRKLLTNANFLDTLAGTLSNLENILERLLLQLVHLQDPSPRTASTKIDQTLIIEQTQKKF
ncbi:unnamed protein product [Fasciola hepatica]|uniref:Uncharacterized protein n=1 Tax=Fasciola hepatica TaxID=6192 RepID=A0ABC9HJC6_FASHE